MQPHTIATAIMASLKSAMFGPDDITHIISSETGEAGDIDCISGPTIHPISDAASFYVDMQNGESFKVDVIYAGRNSAAA